MALVLTANSMPSSWKKELQAEKMPGDKQMEKPNIKGNKYIWSSDFDILPVTCMPTHAQA